MDPNPETPLVASVQSWLQLWDAWGAAWAKAASEAVASEEFAQALGRQLQSYLAATAPARQPLETAGAQSAPASDALLSLGERLTHLEMRLDDLEVKVEELRARVSAPA